MRQTYYVSGFLQPTCIASAKVAILILYYKVFATRGFRIAVWTLAAIVAVWYVGTVLAGALICMPVEYNWNKNIKGHCGSTKLNRDLNPLPWIITDFAILVMPIPMVRKLQLPRSQKFGLAGLFLLGGV